MGVGVGLRCAAPRASAVVGAADGGPLALLWAKGKARGPLSVER